MLQASCYAYSAAAGKGPPPEPTFAPEPDFGQGPDNNTLCYESGDQQICIAILEIVAKNLKASIHSLAASIFADGTDSTKTKPFVLQSSGVNFAKNNKTADEKAHLRAKAGPFSTTSLVIDDLIRALGPEIFRLSLEKYPKIKPANVHLVERHLAAYAGDLCGSIEENLSILPSPRSPSSDSSELSTDFELDSPSAQHAQFHYLAATLDNTECEHCQVAKERANRQQVHIANYRQECEDLNHRIQAQQARVQHLEGELAERGHDLKELWKQVSSIDALNISPAGKEVLKRPALPIKRPKPEPTTPTTRALAVTVTQQDDAEQ